VADKRKSSCEALSACPVAPADGSGVAINKFNTLINNLIVLVIIMVARQN